VKGGDRVVEHDENPLKVLPEKIPGLKPAFRKDGTITPASSSANADGAAAFDPHAAVGCEREGFPILAEIKAHSTHSQDPAWFTTAPIPAIRKVWKKPAGPSAMSTCSRSTRLSPSSPWPRNAISAIPREKLNVNGGACALATRSARPARDHRDPAPCARQPKSLRGVAALCIGGGEATAIAVEH